MENTNHLSSPDVPKEIPQLTDVSVSFILKAAKWGKFLAILGFIVNGLMLIAGIIMGFVLNILPDEMIPLNLPFSPGVLSAIYVLIAVIYIIPVIFLNNFCNQAIKAVQLSSTESMSSSLKNLKNLFVFAGISTIVVLTLYTLMLIVLGSAALISFWF